MTVFSIGVDAVAESPANIGTGELGEAISFTYTTEPRPASIKLA